MPTKPTKGGLILEPRFKKWNANGTPIPNFGTRMERRFQKMERRFKKWNADAKKDNSSLPNKGPISYHLTLCILISQAWQCRRSLVPCLGACTWMGGISVVMFPQTVFSCRGSYGVGKGALNCTAPRRRLPWSKVTVNMQS